MDFNALYISPYLSIQRAEMTKIVKCPSVPTEILLRAHLFLHEWDNEKKQRKTNFIVCLNDNEVKWYSDDTVT